MVNAFGRLAKRHRAIRYKSVHAHCSALRAFRYYPSRKSSFKERIQIRDKSNPILVPADKNHLGI
jgi:hypothetical protein